MAATVNLPRGVPAFNSQAGCLSSAKKISEFFFQCRLRRTSQRVDLYRSTKISNSCSSYGNRESNAMAAAFSPNGVALPSTDDGLMLTRINVNAQRKTKIVCTIGPSTSSRDMIWKLAEAGMNVARLNMSHGDHASHQKTIDLVKEYNAQFQEKVVAIMLDTKGPEVRSGDVPQPILLKEGQEFNFTIKRGVSTADTVSVNYDDFINDVEVGDILQVDGE